jgi:hypothetical protein
MAEETEEQPENISAHDVRDKARRMAQRAEVGVFLAPFALGAAKCGASCSLLNL